MMVDIVEVRPLEGYRLYLRFEDGVEGSVDISNLVQSGGVFEPLKERGFFEQVRVDPDWGTIGWPGEIDLDRDVLYSQVTGIPIAEQLRVNTGKPEAYPTSR